MIQNLFNSLLNDFETMLCSNEDLFLKLTKYEVIFPLTALLHAVVYFFKFTSDNSAIENSTILNIIR